MPATIESNTYAIFAAIFAQVILHDRWNPVPACEWNFQSKNGCQN